jgi:hypothetical protein
MITVLAAGLEFNTAPGNARGYPWWIHGWGYPGDCS